MPRIKPLDTQFKNRKDNAFDNKYQTIKVTPHPDAICEAHYEVQRVITLPRRTEQGCV